MPINVYEIYICIPCNKSIVDFVSCTNFIIFRKKIVVICITLPHRRGSCPDGAHLNVLH